MYSFLCFGPKYFQGSYCPFQPKPLLHRGASDRPEMTCFIDEMHYSFDQTHKKWKFTTFFPVELGRACTLGSDIRANEKCEPHPFEIPVPGNTAASGHS